MWINKERLDQTLREGVELVKHGKSEIARLLPELENERAKVSALISTSNTAAGDIVALKARLEEVEKARDFAVTSFEWMKTQLSQLSYERNKLLEQVTGVPARKLEFGTEQVTSKPEQAKGTGTPLGDGNRYVAGTSFMDIGDVEAERCGIPLKTALEEITSHTGD